MTTGGSGAAPAMAVPATELAEYVLRLGDDALILSQRLCEWVTNAPTIEEDLALANIALDLLGHARLLLSYAGELDGTGRSDDDLSYTRSAREFRNVTLVETANGDFAVTIARQLVYGYYSRLLYTALEESADAVLSGFGAKACKEVAYHCMHAGQWTVRLGLGTQESRRRMQAALDKVWPYVDELFRSDRLTQRLDADCVDPARLRAEWEKEVAAVIAEAGLTVPKAQWTATGGRSGLHTEAFGPLVAVMQSVRRQYPGATW